MCGLVGVVGQIWKVHIEAFETLLTFNQVRGDHSTGVGAIKPGGSCRVIKSVGPPIYLQTMKEYDSFVNTSMIGLIGHGRYATVGDITPNNAHPFNKEHIMGAHNGTLYTDTRKELDPDKKFGTDSEAFYDRVSKRGLESVMPIMTGAWALTFFDKQKHTFNILRNHDRTLFYATVNGGDTLFWASEEGILMAALERTKGIGQIDGPHTVEPNVLYSWDMPTHKRRGLGEPDKREMRGKQYTAATNTGTASTARKAEVGTETSGKVRVDGKWGYTINGKFVAEEDVPWFGNPDYIPNMLDVDKEKVEVSSPFAPALVGPGSRPRSPGHLARHVKNMKLPETGVPEIVNLMKPGVTPGSQLSLPDLTGYSADTRKLSTSVQFRICQALGRTTLSTREWQQFETFTPAEIEDFIRKTIAKRAPTFNKRTEYQPTTITYRDHRNKPLDRKSFDKRTKHGCSACSSDIEYGDHVKFVDHDTVIGECCAQNPEVLQYLKAM